MSTSKDNQADSIEEAFLTNQFGDHYLYSVNRQLFDTLGAEAVYEAYLPHIIWQTNSLFVVVGSDSGLFIEHIDKHGVPNGSRYLFVELDGIEEQVAQRIKPLLNESIILSNPAHWLDEAESLDYKNYLYMNQVYVIKSLGAMHAYLPAYLELFHAVTTETTAWEWFLRQQYASTQFIEGQLANVAENQTPVLALKESFRGKTAVLLASGPSLDELLPWVQENRDQLLVTAISRSSRRLLEDGLTPDIVFTIDPDIISFTVSKHMLTFDPKVLLINSCQTYPRLLAQWRGPKAYLGSCLPWKEEVENPYRGITVTNAAIEALLTMGLSQIVLAGVDLCFKTDGSQYSSGNCETDAGPVLGHIGPKVETNDGHTAETFDSYTQAINNLTEQATRARELGCRLINPAPGAAKIADIDFQAVDNIVFEPLNEKPCITIDHYLPPNDRQNRLDHYQTLDQELARISYRIEKVQNLTNDILHSLAALFGRNGKQSDLRQKDKIIDIENHLEKEFNEELTLVKQIAIREFLHFVGRGKISQRKLEETESDGLAYYQACRDGARTLRQFINNARQRLASRIAEEDEHPDFSKLCHQWRYEGGDNTPARALIWRDHHPEAFATLNPEERELFAKEVNRFEAQIANSTVHLKSCRKVASLENVPNKAKLLFAQQDMEGLRHLVSGLKKFQGDEAEALMHFAAGCLAELEQRDDDALAHYRLVTDGPLLEDTLVRISHLCIQRGDANNALLALECLAHMSVNYVPAYAEVAWLAGHVKEAMELFTQYLQQVPSDLKTYMRLGKLYLKEGITDAARMAFTHVLQQDPGNRTAKIMLQTLDQSQEERQYDNA